MIAITGATGQLGRLVIEALLQTTPASEIVAAVRSPEKATMFTAAGVLVRKADYTQPETLVGAFSGVDTLLLISSNAIGERVEQHRAAIDAAKQAGVKLIAYTSVLHADTSPLGLAREHRETELLLQASGVPFVVLRNGWYTENHTAAIPAALAHEALLGSAGNGRISSAARADYAAAAALVLKRENQAGKIYELAGDGSYDLGEFAAELSRQSGRNIAYVNMPQQDYKNALIGAGLPESVADLLADSDVGASAGGLFDEGHQLSALIGRPTIPLAVSIAAALKDLEK